MTPENNSFCITPFDGTKYFAWRRKAVGYLTIKGVWSTICVEEIVSKTQKEVETNEKEAKAFAYLQSIISDDIIDSFDQNSASAIWKALEDRYQGQDALTITILQNKLRGIFLNEDGDFEEYLRLLKSTYKELSGSGKVYSDTEKGQQLLSGLPPSYFPFIMSLSSTSPTELTFDRIEKSLRAMLILKVKSLNRKNQTQGYYFLKMKRQKLQSNAGLEDVTTVGKEDIGPRNVEVNREMMEHQSITAEQILPLAVGWCLMQWAVERGTRMFGLLTVEQASA